MTHKNTLKVKDHACSGEMFEVIPVSGSSLLRTIPVPDNLEAYYQSNYISHEDNPTTFIGRIYQWVKKFMLSQKLSWIGAWSPAGSELLDIGAGTGSFLLAAQRKGWKVMGVEPNQTAREIARKKQLEVESEMSKLGQRRFDVVTMWHVLEHIPDPEETTREVSQILSEDGVVVLALPNHKSLDAKIYQSLWAAYDVPRHLWHFDSRSITELMEKQGYEKIDQRPLLFDAFYVSLVSERFKGKGGNTLRGLWNGLRSNLSAMRTGEYSSLVYAFKKA